MNLLKEKKSEKQIQDLMRNSSLCHLYSSKMDSVFTSEKYFENLTGSFKYSQREKNLKIYSYVILDNHFHSVLSGNNLSQTIASIKSYTARTIIDLLKADKKDWLLNQLEYYKLKHKSNSEYQFCREGFHPQMIYSEEVYRQKVEYIHFNPVKRGLVREPEHWNTVCVILV
ncbi:MAG: transposase [Ignavibacteria bacterium]|nr:transposase [Ignavibacteria bacterium]